MRPFKCLASLVLVTLLTACSSVEVKIWPSDKFAAGNFQTYSWRTEPFVNTALSRDPIYVVDPILREVLDAELQARGFRLVPRGGDFTVDYTYAPGWVQGAESEATSNISPRAGVRPNTRISGAERDNAIALSGVRETRNITLQFKQGDSNVEVWRATMMKIASDVNEIDRERLRRALQSGIPRALEGLPSAGQANAG